MSATQSQYVQPIGLVAITMNAYITKERKKVCSELLDFILFCYME